MMITRWQPLLLERTRKGPWFSGVIFVLSWRFYIIIDATRTVDSLRVLIPNVCTNFVETKYDVLFVNYVDCCVPGQHQNNVSAVTENTSKR